MTETLSDIARAMVAPGKGILAADESSGTIKKRFDKINLASTEESRRDYREMLFRSTDAMKNHVSGVILYDETIRQKAKDGTPLAWRQTLRGKPRDEHVEGVEDATQLLAVAAGLPQHVVFDSGIARVQAHEDLRVEEAIPGRLGRDHEVLERLLERKSGRPLVHGSPPTRRLPAVDRPCPCNAAECRNDDQSGWTRPHYVRQPRPQSPLPSLISTGTYLYAAGTATGRLASYRIDGATGALVALDVYSIGRRPAAVLAVPLGR